MKKKKLITALSVLFATSFSGFLFACGEVDKGGIKSIEFEGLKTEYTEDDTALDLSTLKVNLEYKNKDPETNKRYTAELLPEQCDIDFSQVEWGTRGTYEVTVTPKDQSGDAKVSEKFTITIDHAFGAADENGIETCQHKFENNTICGAERQQLKLDDTVVTVAWNNQATYTSTTNKISQAPREGENHVSYGTVSIGQKVSLTMEIDAVDTAATWNTPLMGIRNGDVGILPREDAYVIGVAAGYTTPATGSKDTGATAGSADESSTEWICYSSGSTWSASDLAPIGNEKAVVVVTYNYRTDGIMEIIHSATFAGSTSARVLTYTIKVPAAAYEIVCYGEKVTMHVTDYSIVKNLKIDTFTMQSEPTKKIYAENEMFDTTGIAATAKYLGGEGLTTPVTTYNIYADDAAGKVVNLATTPLTRGLTNFRLEFEGKTIALQGIEVRPSLLNIAYNSPALAEAGYASADSEARYGVVNGNVAVILSGKASRAADGTTYVAFALGNTVAANAKITGVEVTGVTAIKAEVAGGAALVAIPVTDETKNVVVKVTGTYKDRTEAETTDVYVDLSALEIPKYTTGVSGAAYLDEGGDIVVTYYGVASKEGFTLKLGKYSATVTDVEAALAQETPEYKVYVGQKANPTAYVSAVAFDAEAKTLAVTYTLAAPKLEGNAFTAEFEASLLDASKNVLAEETLAYTFAMSENAAKNGYVQIAENVYVKAFDGQLVLVTTGATYDLNKISSSVSLNIQNESGIAYDLSVEAANGAAALTGYNDATKASSVVMTYVGTFGNSYDIDVGAVIVTKIDVTKLGLNGGYFFEVIGTEQGKVYTIYKVEEGAITPVTVDTTGMERTAGTQGDCLIGGTAAFEYTIAEGETFKFGSKTVEATGIHTYDENGVCTVCGTTVYGDKTEKNMKVGAIANATKRGYTLSFHVSGVTSDWGSAVASAGSYFITLPNLDPWGVMGANKFPGSNNLFNGGAWNSFLNCEADVLLVVAPSGITYYKNGVKVVEYKASELLEKSTNTVEDFINGHLALVEKEGFTFAAGADIGTVSNLTVYTAALTSYQLELVELNTKPVTIGDKTFQMSNMAPQEIINLDESGAWWTGGTTDFRVSGDFAIRYTWNNVRDVNWCQDCVIEFNTIGDAPVYFDITNMQSNPWSDLTKDTTKTTTVLVNGEVGKLPVQGDAAEGAYEGSYTVYVVRIGSTLYIYQECVSTKGDVYTVIDVISGFTTDDLMARLTGNPYWVDDITATVGTAKDVTPAKEETPEETPAE